ncbi:MAG: hypothetical protein ACKO7P_04015 [Bacteroidota bacterium]
MKKVIFMCAISSMILLPSCKRLLNKDSKNPSKEVSKDASDGANSDENGAGENGRMDTPAMPNPQVEPAQTEPAQAEPAQAEPAQTEGASSGGDICECVMSAKNEEDAKKCDPSKTIDELRSIYDDCKNK